MKKKIVGILVMVLLIATVIPITLQVYGKTQTVVFHENIDMLNAGGEPLNLEASDIEIQGDKIIVKYHVVSGSCMSADDFVNAVTEVDLFTYGTKDRVQSEVEAYNKKPTGGFQYTVNMDDMNDDTNSNTNLLEVTLTACCFVKFVFHEHTEGDTNDKEFEIIIASGDEEVIVGWAKDYGYIPGLIGELEDAVIKSWVEDSVPEDNENVRGAWETEKVTEEDKGKQIEKIIRVHNGIDGPVIVTPDMTIGDDGDKWNPKICDTAKQGFTLEKKCDHHDFWFRCTVPDDIKEGDELYVGIVYDTDKPDQEVWVIPIDLEFSRDETLPFVGGDDDSCKAEPDPFEEDEELGETVIGRPWMLTFRIAASDECSGVDYVKVSYSLDDGSWESEVMVGTRGSDDKILFVNDVPFETSKVNYRFTAVDKAGNMNTTETFTYYIPKLEVTRITGGFGVSADIRNSGGTDEDVRWSIDLSGFLLFGNHSEGIISVAVDETKTISTERLFGLGPTIITITAGYAIRTARGFMLGPFVIGVT